jgi:Lrp/AsnC family leucine-responsive transcriptional regulator
MNSKLEESSIDKIDLKLLRLLQRDALASTENLGDEVGLSPTAAKRRVNKMRAGGVIARDVSIVDHKQLGFDVFSLVFVNLERDRRDIMNNFKRAIREHPRILQAFYTTGDADFVLLVASQTLADYEEFTQKFFWEKPDIKSFRTMIVMESVKLGLEFPLEELIDSG